MTMNKNTYLRLTLAALMGLSAPLFAEDASTPGQSINPSAQTTMDQQNKDATVPLKSNSEAKKPDLAYRKWTQEEQERSGHIGYSFFERHNKKL